MRVKVNIKGDWVVDAEVPDGEQHGYDIEGRLICIVVFKPEYKFVMGDHDAAEYVHRWHMSPAGYADIQERARLAAAAYKWRLEGYPTEGVA